MNAHFQPPKPTAFLPRWGGFGDRPVFDAAVVAKLLRDASADPVFVATFVAANQQFFSRAL